MNENIQESGQQQQQQTLDFKVILFKLYRYWYTFILTIFIALSIAFLFNKYTRPIYEASTTILIKDKSEKQIDVQDILGLGRTKGIQNLTNQMALLSSYSLASKTVTKLGFEVAYYTEEDFVTKELYKTCPFTVILDTSVLQPYNLRFNLTILSKDKYKLDVKEENVSFYSYPKKELDPDKTSKISEGRTFSFGKEVVDKDYKFKILLNSNFDSKKNITKKYYFVLKDYDGLVSEFKGLKIEPINKDASIVSIKLRGGNVDKMIDFLNALTKEYIEEGLDDKNLIANRTIAFIDNELKDITDTLYSSERALQVFRKNNEIMNLDNEAQAVFEKMSALQDEKARLSVQSKYLQNLKDYLETNQKLDELIVPASMGVDNGLINDLTMQLITLYSDRLKLTQYAKEKSPALKTLDLQISSTKNALMENIKGSLNNYKTALKEINGRIGQFTGKINQLPETQRVLFGIERKFKLTDATYTYLLQKRSEAQITQASNLADNEVIDAATGSNNPVSPVTSLNYIIAMVLGLILPLIYIFGKDFLNDKVVTKEDVEKLTNFPIIGHIIHTDNPSKKVIIETPKSSLAESFRLVRTNLQYLMQGKEKYVILVTSDMVNTGKTFVSINLATIFAMYGRKTLLMGYDLRKPKIYGDFNISNAEGISSYMINKSTLENIIQPSGIDNLDIITAGPVPPNPSELIANPKTKELLKN